LFGFLENCKRGCKRGCKKVARRLQEGCKKVARSGGIILGEKLYNKNEK